VCVCLCACMCVCVCVSRITAYLHTHTHTHTHTHMSLSFNCRHESIAFVTEKLNCPACITKHTISRGTVNTKCLFASCRVRHRLCVGLSRSSSGGEGKAGCRSMFTIIKTASHDIRCTLFIPGGKFGFSLTAEARDRINN